VKGVLPHQSRMTPDMNQACEGARSSKVGGGDATAAWVMRISLRASEVYHSWMAGEVDGISCPSRVLQAAGRRGRPMREGGGNRSSITAHSWSLGS
jgi:hypothetical protein